MQPRKIIRRHQNKREKLYLFYRGQWLAYLAFVLVTTMVFIFNSVAVFAALVLAGILAVVCCKRYTSFRFFPMFTTLRMDEHYVQKEHIIVLPHWPVWLERLSLEEIYLTEARYHGLRYVIFSATPIQDTGWKAVAKNEDVIVYPFHTDMKWDFPELFRKFAILPKK